MLLVDTDVPRSGYRVRCAGIQRMEPARRGAITHQSFSSTPRVPTMKQRFRVHMASFTSLARRSPVLCLGMPSRRAVVPLRRKSRIRAQRRRCPARPRCGGFLLSRAYRSRTSSGIGPVTSCPRGCLSAQAHSRQERPEGRSSAWGRITAPQSAVTPTFDRSAACPSPEIWCSILVTAQVTERVARVVEGRSFSSMMASIDGPRWNGRELGS